MPPTSRSSLELMLDRLGFGFFRYVDVLLTTLFITAIVLGVARLVFLAVLALCAPLHRARPRAADARPGRPGRWSVVLIPCFNEEKVIVASVTPHPRTPTGSGSRCWCSTTAPATRTAAKVREAFGDEPRVDAADASRTAARRGR